MGNISVTVDKQLVEGEIKKFKNYLARADKVTKDSTLSELNIAQNTLFMARGAFSTLWGLKLLPASVDDEIFRIEVKQRDILEYKNSKPVCKY